MDVTRYSGYASLPGVSDDDLLNLVDAREDIGKWCSCGEDLRLVVPLT
jgi:hypothetical protein